METTQTNTIMENTKTTTREVHTLILGAGPSGLAAGLTLAKAGLKPVVLERDKVSGGLMRSVQHGEFILDIGRKELYNRLAKVDEFWSGLLGADYRVYPRRAGILYDGKIIEMSPAYRGFRRGMSWSLFLRCGWDFLRWRAGLVVSTPRNLEEYWYKQRGSLLTRIANQGFQEKLAGNKWSEIPLPPASTNGAGSSFLGTIGQALKRAFSEDTEREAYVYKGIWRHPAKGSGQICECMERGILEHGGEINLGARILEIRTSEGRIESVLADVGAERIEFRPKHVVASTPVEVLEGMLTKKPSGAQPAPSEAQKAARSRTLILVYLFVDEAPRFPHVWLQVTCPNTQIGRIANYAALNSDMVPKGKTCLCCEIYCFDQNPLPKLTDKELGELAIRDCAKSGLIDAAKCSDTHVIRFPGADASQGRHNWLNEARQRLLIELRKFKNLYPVNRADLDIATVAGLDAAEAIIQGDRSAFDLHIDPIHLGIQKTSKPLEFSHPAGVRA